MSSNTPDSSQTLPTLSPTEALWAHVLRKDKLQPKSLDLPQVPAGPVDRNATSTRILLYDTQARLEQFTSRSDAMLKNMQDANHQLKTVGMLFEKDRDSLTNDMIDLVNRSQREIQKAVGSPAQEPQFLAFQEKMDLRIEGLNQRLDALQMFNQTHCQALETHSQILKSIQDQQNTLLSAVLPQLPLIQTLPSLIEQTKTGVQEMNAHLSTGITDLKQDLASRIGGSFSLPKTSLSSRKRRLSGLSPNHSPLEPKRIRTKSPLSPSSISTAGSDDKLSRPVELPELVSTIIKSPATRSLAPTIKPSAFRQRSVFATTKTESTVRELPSVPSRASSIMQSPFVLRTTTSPIQKRSPIMSRIPSRSSQKEQLTLPDVSRPPSTPISASWDRAGAHLPRARTTPRHLLSIGNSLQQPSISPPISRKPTVKPFLQPSLPGSIHPPTIEPLKSSSITALNVPAGLYLSPRPSFIAVNQSRDRHSPSREGRRFIPLDDDDDDDEDEEDNN